MTKYTKNVSRHIHRLLLVLVLVLTSLTAAAGASNNNLPMQLQSAYYTTGYVWDGSTYWRHYAYVSENNDGTFMVYAARQCYRDYGTCTWYDADFCRVYSAGKDIVLVANKSHILIDLKPSDCDYSQGNPIGSQLSLDANGRYESAHKYNSYRNRWEGPNGVQCMYHSKNGSFESRSADVSGTIEGEVVLGERNIETRTTGHWIQNCSN